MPSVIHPIEPGGPRRLQVFWELGWRNVRVLLDGAELGRIEDRAGLEAGRRFVLPDGAALEIRLVRSLMGAELLLRRNGEPLPGSDGAFRHVRVAALCLLLLALVFVAYALREARSPQPGALVGPVALLLGLSVVLGVTGLLAMRGSYRALLAGTVVFSLYTLALASFGLRAGQLPPLLLPDLVMIAFLVRGLRSMRRMSASTSPAA